MADINWSPIIAEDHPAAALLKKLSSHIEVTYFLSSPGTSGLGERVCVKGRKEVKPLLRAISHASQEGAAPL
jgi:hypothetical protein